LLFFPLSANNTHSCHKSTRNIFWWLRGEFQAIRKPKIFLFATREHCPERPQAERNRRPGKAKKTIRRANASCTDQETKAPEQS
jgi:hypothetical protein